MLHRLQAKYAPYLFVAPFIIIFGTFGLYPILNSIYLSLHITSGPRDQVFVWFDNFVLLMSDPDFWKAVRNTVVFALFSVFLQLPLSLGLAMLMNASFLRFRNLFRFVFFCPYLMGVVFAALLFSLLFADQVGLVNNLLHALLGGGKATSEWLEIRWLTEASYVMPAIIILSLWLYVGFNMIYFLAALQAVDRELYEAAAVDGANAWNRFVHVTMPGIKPVAVFVVVLSTIGSMRMFEMAWLLLNQQTGPDQAGLFIVTYLYQNGFVTGDLGYASAIGWTLVIGVLVLTLFQIRVSGTMKKEAS
jgi:ABC-type sugar transport system permease subunit